MTTPVLMRRDSYGHIISKKSKEYHISFNNNIDIIDVQSYKKLNILKANAYVEDLFFGDADNKSDGGGEEAVAPKSESSFENAKRGRIRRYSNRNPNALKNIGCSIF